MRQAVRKFGKALRGSGKDAVGLLFYAGHGIQAKGQNFLIPLGAQIESTADLSLEALSASDILAQMEEAGNRLNLVILDACRNNPLKGRVRSGGRGLARIQAASGSLVAFAAAPGQVASDGPGTNSPYTSALVKAMREPGLAVEQVFKLARVNVENETGGEQTPWEESSLRGDFYFVSGRPSASDSQPSTPATVSTDALDLAFWKSIQDTKSPAYMNSYLKKYPKGQFAAIARLRLEQLEAELTPSTGQSDADDKVSGRELMLGVQQELDRLGCKPGKPDGVWGRKSKRALDAYARHAGVTFANLDPSIDMLNDLKSKTGRVCPLVCGPRYTVKGQVCVLKRCPKGQKLRSSGVCSVQKAKSARRSKTESSRRKKPKFDHPDAATSPTGQLPIPRSDGP